MTCCVGSLLLVQVMQTFNSDTGEKEAISYRCSDMDRQVPYLMGVSKVRQQTLCLIVIAG